MLKLHQCLNTARVVLASRLGTIIQVVHVYFAPRERFLLVGLSRTQPHALTASPEDTLQALALTPARFAAPGISNPTWGRLIATTYAHLAPLQLWVLPRARTVSLDPSLRLRALPPARPAAPATTNPTWDRLIATPCAQWILTD